MLPRLALPPSRTVLAILALAFVAPGLVGHDPWRAFDVLAIEVVHQMDVTGDWTIPRVAGQPWLDDPPFFHWLALVFAKLFGSLLGFHNAVRLASGLAMFTALWFLYLAARHSALPIATRRYTEEDLPLRRGDGAAGTLLLIGSLGLMVHAHEAVPDLAALAASCVAFAFLMTPGSRPAKTGAAFGAALGVAFLSTGPVVPLMVGITAVVAHVVCDEWRTPRAPRFLGAALAAFLVVACSWPLALWLRSPEVAQAWWYLATHTRDEFLANLRYYLTTASWFAWPAWPLAAWAAWTLRKEWRTPRVFVPLMAALLGVLLISWAGPQQDINTMALLPPLALLGAHGVGRLRRGAANMLDWFGVMTFGFFAFLIWVGYFAMQTGLPPKLARNFSKMAPGFEAQFALFPFLVALALTLAWLYLAFFTAPSPTRGAARWAAGLALLWGTFATLWLPWADHVKSYRSVALQLKSVMPAGANCVAGRELGAPQRAALSYHAAIEPVAGERGRDCSVLIVQGHPKNEVAPVGAGWKKLADVGRPGDRGERYRLYRRQ
jgi:4-amino-4-deoxy-L-arabinose transferase-like glycosyltransferase